MVEPARPGSSPESFDSASISPLSDTDLSIKKVASRSFSTPPSIGVPIKPDSETKRIDLKKVATDPEEGLGNKAANLIQLEVLGFNVPEFKGFSSRVIMDYILGGYPGFLTDYAAFVETKDVGLLEKVRAGIETAFSREDTPELPGLRDWIRLHPAPTRFAVRSTGYEDSDDVANAGANKTILFTASTIEALTLSVKEVVKSYFSETSMLQRMASGDPSISTSVPFVPVLVQVMVDGDASGIMAVRDGLSEIAVGIGLNDGVATGRSLTDSIIFMPGGEVRFVVQNKPTGCRGVENEAGEIECLSVPCSRDISEKPAVSKEIALRLKQIGTRLRTFYGKDLDIEFTVKDGVIYLLQVRPLKERDLESEPSYLERGESSIQCETITNGGNFVREITNPSEVLFVRTIDEARETFSLLRGEQDGVKIKGIVIQEKAPRTSHGAIFFMGLGLPVLQTEQRIELSSGEKLYLDPQQGLIAKTGEIREGYVCYPIPLRYSMETSVFVQAMHMQTYVRVLERGEFIRKEMAKLEKRVASFPPAREITFEQMPAALEVIKRGSLEEAKAAASSLAHLIYQTTKEKDITHKSRIELIMVLENLLDVLEKDPISAGPMTLERLYTARLIEACLFQDGKGIIGGFSFTRSLRAIKMQRLGSLELKKPHSEETLQDIPFVKIKLQILKEEAQAQWGEMIKHLDEVSEEDKAIARELFQTIDSVGASTEFVNVTLLKLMEESGPDIGLLFDKLKDIAIVLQPTLEKALAMHRFVLEERANLNAWSDPEHIARNFSRLQLRLLELGLAAGPSSLVDFFREASSESKLILGGSIHEVVECCDELIKQCTGSTKYPSYKAKAQDFSTLLHPYRDMLIVIKQSLFKRVNLQSENFKINLDLELITEDQARELLQVSSGFNVAQLIQDGIEYSNNHPKVAISLEEKFTLFHQAMRKDLSKSAVDCGFSEHLLPNELRGFIEGFNSEYTEDKSIVSIQMDKSSIFASLRIPLRQHGANFIVQFDKTTKKTAMTISIYGDNENDRWNRISKLSDFLAAQLGFEVKIAEVGSSFVAISLAEKLIDEDSKRNSCLFLDTVLEASFTLSGIQLKSEQTLLQVVPKELQTKELCLEEVGKNLRAIKHVARQFLYDVTRKYPEARRYLLDPNEFFLPSNLDLPPIPPSAQWGGEILPPPPYKPPKVEE
jgi:hypothetical protein